MQKPEIIDRVLNEPITLSGVTHWLELGDCMEFFPHFAPATKLKEMTMAQSDREVAAVLKEEMPDVLLPAAEVAKQIAVVLKRIRQTEILDLDEAVRNVAAAVGNESTKAFVSTHLHEVVEWAAPSNSYVQEFGEASDPGELSCLMAEHMDPEFSARIFELLEIQDLYDG